MCACFVQRRHSELLEKIKASKSVKSRAPRVIRRESGAMEEIKPFKKKVVSSKSISK